jgi:hypothetical protein
MDAANRLYAFFVAGDYDAPAISGDGGDGFIVVGGNAAYRIVNDRVVATGDVYVGGRIDWDAAPSDFRLAFFDEFAA